MTSTVSRCVFCILTIVLVASGSVQLRRQKRAAFEKYAHLWPDGVIPYVIDASYFTHNELRDLDFAFETWNRETCVQFRPRQNGDQAWIRITDGDKCWSEYIGYSGRKIEQLVILGRRGCRFYGTYLHELGHVLGLQHEHSRPERDNYIFINYYGVRPGSQPNFFKRKESQVITYDSPYDLQSVMHYGMTAFANSPDVNTMQIKDPKLRYLIRDVHSLVLSFWDVIATNRHYKCESKCRSPPLDCPYPGFIDQYCRCQTPEEFAKRWCVDTLDERRCAQLAENRGCYHQANYMALNCRQTCGFCYKFNPVEIDLPPRSPTTTTSQPRPLMPIEGCRTKKDPSYGCPRYAAECDSVETFRRCPNICENCGTCEDTMNNCADLKIYEYCTQYPQSTVRGCRQSCGACDA